MIVEFIGTPGAGKTTHIPTVIALLKEQGIQGRTVVEAARSYAQRTLPGQIIARLAPPSWRRPLLWQLFDLLSALYRLIFFLKHPRLVRQVIISQRRRPAAARIKERRVLYWFFRTAGYYEFLTRYTRPDEALIFDEGFIHRVVQLNVSTAEEPQAANIVAYANLLPRPDLVIFVQASPSVCQQRVCQRGLWDHFQMATASEVALFINRAHWVVNQAVACVRAAGWMVIEVDNDHRELSEVQDELRRKFGAFGNDRFPVEIKHHDADNISTAATLPDQAGPLRPDTFIRH
jgi:thymidylate kinase